jgi:Tol biopolymer transport system component
MTTALLVAGMWTNAGAAPPTAAATALADTVRVSLATHDRQVGRFSDNPALSGNARFTAFVSRARMATSDRNATLDVYLRDRLTHTTRLVTQTPEGAAGNGAALHPDLTPDGRLVAFMSAASDLVAGDTNSEFDVFVRDRQSGSTERVSLSNSGQQANGFQAGGSLSDDGRFVAFTSDDPALLPIGARRAANVFVRDRALGTTERVSVGPGGVPANGACHQATISGDGRSVAFTSEADNLVPRDANNGSDVFVRDRMTGTTTRVSVSSAGAEGDGESFGGGLAADGQYVAYVSSATNLVPNDTNGWNDIFVTSLAGGGTRRASVGTAGAQGDSDSFGPSISRTGRYVAFTSGASNLVPGGGNPFGDVYVRDRDLGTTTLISLGSAGQRGDGSVTDNPAISDNGRHVGFVSTSTNLVPGDTNGVTDVFVRLRWAN